MDWTDRRSTLGLILTLSLGFCTLFLVTASFMLPGLFEFLGLITLIAGWFVVAPAYYFLTRSNAESDGEADDERSDRSERATDPVEILQRRYANGELSESEFEHKLDRLLETDRTTGDSSAALGDEAGPASGRGDPDRASDARGRNRELDRDRDRDRYRDRDRDHDLEYE